MADASGTGGQTSGRDLLALLGLVGAVQLLLSYQTVVGDGGLDLFDNLLWPYLAIGSLAYWSGRLRTATVKLVLSAVGAALAGVSFVVDTAPAKLLVTSVLVVAAVFYAMEVFAGSETGAFASP